MDFYKLGMLSYLLKTEKVKMLCTSKNSDEHKLTQLYTN